MNQEYRPAIVIPAYGRSESLKRLLESVNQAWYPDDPIPLVISIDGGAKQGVLDLADAFEFDFGNKRVIRRDHNLGVKEHIIQCADMSLEFGSVIILEDDLVAGPAYYRFAVKALEFYDMTPEIAGVSLYSQRYNETSELPFEPLEKNWPAYFMQLGCSWGQAWTKKQWSTFKTWVESRGNVDTGHSSNLPENISKWPDSSWKKSFNEFLIDTNRFIVYPYSSYTTNSADKGGTHMQFVENRFQVPLNVSSSLGNDFQLPQFDDCAVKYDAFMEPGCGMVCKWMDMKGVEIELDLYGKKPVDLLRRKPFAITSKKVNHYIRSFPLSFRPLELNLKFGSENQDTDFFYLVDTKTLTGNEKPKRSTYFRMLEYFIYGTVKTKRFAKLYFAEILKYALNRLHLFRSNK